MRDAMTAKDIRWEQRFSNYRKALSQLKKFIDKEAQEELSELEKQGLVKAFEYTYELAWTTLKDFLEFRGQKDIYGSRDATRKAFELGLIEHGEDWMDMLQSRNLTSHTYNEEVAEQICRAVVGTYYPLFRKLEKKLDSLHSRLEQSATKK
jgi:nucleotidyltransferase substrate binding protein (TIGR01987 family)